ncbi:Fic family protein [Corynebacterium fournieri]|uniref:Fic family protein n=1 Tax=Corynebacterium fournieri TaxID=1852390 RepID=UPI000A2F83F7|nr:Fic family protein [Corynebacterium fournieri]WJY98408.1 Adenosine monophosphate-protein transferase SoFic [Corynebacterium fournieri]
MNNYKSLKTVFHKSSDGQRAAETEYFSRFSSPATLHWDFAVGKHQLFAVLTAENQSLLEQVWRAELRISHKWSTLPGAAASHYLTGLLIEEIKSTNQIEGVHSTRREIAEALTRPSTGPHKRFREMVAFYESLLNPNDRPEFPRTPASLRAEYDKLLANEIDEDDRPDGHLFRAGTVEIHDGIQGVHKAPLGEDNIEERMQTFLSTQHDETHVLINALIGHFIFEYTHPFYDGNGRMGRFLLAFKALEVLSPPTSMSLSHQFSLQRKKYYAAFVEAENPMNYGEATFFIEAMLEMLIDAQNDLETSLDQKHFQLRSLQDVLSSLDRDEYERDLLFLAAQAFLFGPDLPFPLKDAVSTMGRSWNTIRPVAEDLETEGLIQSASKRPLTLELTTRGREYLHISED